MKVAIIQSNYLPWKGYFDIINDADIFCFYDEVKYTKNDWRNRNKIYSKNGLQWLPIPIYKDAVKQKISEVRLDESSWQDLHYTTLSQSYASAPYFHQLKPLLEDFYKNNHWNFLSEFNQYSIKKISVCLGIETKFVDSKDFDLKGDRIERLLNLLGDLRATEYISGPAAEEYIGDSYKLFERKNIKLRYKKYPSYPEYRQLKTPFENGVSIVDMMANIKFEDIKKYIWA